MGNNVEEQLIRGQSSGDNYSGCNFPPGQLFLGAVIRGDIVLGGNYPVGNCREDNRPGGNYPGDKLSFYDVHLFSQIV